VDNDFIRLLSLPDREEALEKSLWYGDVLSRITEDTDMNSLSVYFPSDYLTEYGINLDSTKLIITLDVECPENLEDARNFLYRFHKTIPSIVSEFLRLHHVAAYGQYIKGSQTATLSFIRNGRNETSDDVHYIIPWSHHIAFDGAPKFLSPTTWSLKFRLAN